MASPHDAYGVIKEEFDELWDGVRLKPSEHPERLELCKKEAVHLAAMAIRFLVDLC